MWAARAKARVQRTATVGASRLVRCQRWSGRRRGEAGRVVGRLAWIGEVAAMD